MSNAINTLAASKAIKDGEIKTARKAVTPGEYEVSLTMQVTGKITVGEDYLRAPTVSIPLLEVLALFAFRAGCTREFTKQAIKDSVTEALASEGKAKGAILAAHPEIEEALAEAKALMASLTPAKVAGPVTTDLHYEILG
jgi:phage shock protein A